MVLDGKDWWHSRSLHDYLQSNCARGNNYAHINANLANESPQHLLNWYKTQDKDVLCIQMTSPNNICVLVMHEIFEQRWKKIFTCVSDKFSDFASSFLSWPTTYWFFSKACSSLSSWLGEKAVLILFGFLKGRRNSGSPGCPETKK